MFLRQKIVRSIAGNINCRSFKMDVLKLAQLLIHLSTRKIDVLFNPGDEALTERYALLERRLTPS